MSTQPSSDRVRTADVPAPDRLEFWEHTLSTRLWPVAIAPVNGASHDFRTEFVSVGAQEAMIARGVIDPVRTRVSRSQAAQREATRLLLSMQTAGRLAVEARGQRTLYPGRSLLIQTDDEPNVHTHSGRTPMVLLSVNAAQLSIPMAKLRPLMFRPLRIDARSATLFTNAAHAAQRSTETLDAAQMSDYLHGVADLLLRTVSGGTIEHGGTAVVRRHQALDIIRARIADPALTSASVAEELGISVRRLQQIFAGDVSVARQIQDLRIARAQRLLRDPQGHQEAIATIAALCGYSDHATFSRAFRRATGMRPKDCRR